MNSQINMISILRKNESEQSCVQGTTPLLCLRIEYHSLCCIVFEDTLRRGEDKMSNSGSVILCIAFEVREKLRGGGGEENKQC